MSPAGDADTLTDLDAGELSGRLAARKCRSVDVMAAYLDRIEARNPALNAIVALRDRDVLMAEAALADRTPRKGWLHGIPVAVKDLADTRDIVTTYGSPLYARHRPTADAGLVRRLRGAGAIVIGKTNTPEFGLGSHTYNPVYGVTRNPFDRQLSAGGSSGGAAAALAARLVPIADGSDMMGSLRNPAAFNNVYGFRPSVGRIPADDAGDSCTLPLSTSGPMGRSIDDIARLLDTLSAPDRTTPWNLPDVGTAAPLDAMDGKRPLAGKCIGWIGDADGFFPMEAGVLDCCERALDDFTALGCEVRPLHLDIDLAALFDAWMTLRSAAIAGQLRGLYEDAGTRDRLKPEAQWEIGRGLGLSAMQVYSASSVRSAWFAAAARHLETVDLLCLPSAAVFPFDATLDWVSEIAGATMRTYHEWMSVVVPASMAGLPTLAVPAGFNDAGLPAGLQLIGRYGADVDVLRIGEAYHRATDWPRRRPPPLP